VGVWGTCSGLLCGFAGSGQAEDLPDEGDGLLQSHSVSIHQEINVVVERSITVLVLMTSNTESRGSVAASDVVEEADP
jgi:hypothetical protein